MLTASRNALSSTWSFITETLPAAIKYPFQKPKEFIIGTAIPYTVSANKVISVVGNSMYNIEKFINWLNQDDNSEPPLGFNDYLSVSFTAAYLLLLAGDVIITANRGPGTVRHWEKKLPGHHSKIHPLDERKSAWKQLQEDIDKIQHSSGTHMIEFLLKFLFYLLKFCKNTIIPPSKSELGWITNIFYTALVSLGFVSSGFAALSNYFGVGNFINFIGRKLFTIDIKNISQTFLYTREAISLFSALTSYLSSMATTQPSQVENSEALCKSFSEGNFKILGHSWSTYFKISVFLVGNIPIFFLSRFTTEHALENLKNVSWIKWLNSNTFVSFEHIDDYKNFVSDFSGFSATSSFILSALIESVKKKEEVYFDEELSYEGKYRKTIYVGSFLITLENLISNFSGTANTLQKNYGVNTRQPVWIGAISFSTLMYCVQVYNFYCKKIMEDNLKHWHLNARHNPQHMKKQKIGECVDNQIEFIEEGDLSGVENKFSLQKNLSEIKVLMFHHKKEQESTFDKISRKLCCN